MRTFLKILLTLFLTLLLLAAACLYGMYWYENNVDRGGWATENGVYYYKDFYGDPVTGWQEIDGSNYYISTTDTSIHTYSKEIDWAR